jgi:hypothetical protein
MLSWKIGNMPIEEQNVHTQVSLFIIFIFIYIQLKMYHTLFINDLLYKIL